MLDLLLSFVVIFFPFVVYFFGFKYLNQKVELSKATKIILTLLFIVIGIGFSIWAISIYLNSLTKGTKCGNGAAIYFPIGFYLYFAGIPLVTFVLNKKKPQIRKFDLNH